MNPTNNKYLFSNIFNRQIKYYHLCETCSQLAINDCFEKEVIDSLIDHEENGCYYSLGQIIQICSKMMLLNLNDKGKWIDNEEDKNYRKDWIDSTLTNISNYCNENHK